MRYILVTTSLALFFLGCSEPYPTNNIPTKHTFVKPNKIQTTGTSAQGYNSRYPNFNYQQLGYSNNVGGYYGYYDRGGYEYDNRYYEYGNGYTYDDRYNRSGNFNTQRSHTRVYHPSDGDIGYGGLSYQNSRENQEARMRTGEY